MSLSDHLPSEEWVSDFWPALVGVAVIAVGNVYYHGVLGNEFTPISPPLFVALGVVLVLEIGRTIHARSERSDA